MTLPVGPEVRFTLTELTFDQITDSLVSLERELGFSVLELFRRYVNGDLDHDSENVWGELINLFFLYLGTREVRRWSCP